VLLNGFPRRLLSTLVLAAVVAGAGLGGYFIYSAAKQMVVQAQIKLPDPPSITSPQEKASPQASSEPQVVLPLSVTPTATPSVQSAHERINIMVLGLDVPDGEAEPARTDSIIIVSVDPSGGPIAMLSVPRDLYVPIASYGENRINTAYFLGEVKDYPGGGPGLLRATIEQTFGIPIHYYVSVDFDGFRELVDELGGVKLTVEDDIYDPEFPDGKGGTMVVSIAAGNYTMDGEMALQYARSRHTTSDFDRAKRQQHLLMAMRDQVLSRDSLSSLITKAPVLYGTLSRSVETDLSLEDLINLARLASTIDLNDVNSAVIDQTMTTRYLTDQGWDVLLPIPEKIQPLVQRLFLPSNGGSQANTADSADVSDQVAAEAARVMLVNGSGRAGLAEDTAKYLRVHGVPITEAADLDRGDYANTVIVAYREEPATVAALVSALGLSSGNVRLSPSSPNPDQVDVKIILGQDFNLPSG
jgi:polyisoprenyl-teichoic acid--peptidoglycan teichoic acid transferase